MRLALLLLAGCPHPGGLPSIELALNGHALRVEVADEPEERALGLMYRDSLGEDRGMLFVYPDAQPRSFWMENTRIPLSIAFIGPDGHIVRIADMAPLDRGHTRSGQPARYALETNRGWFEAHGVAVGAWVEGLPEASEL